MDILDKIKIDNKKALKIYNEAFENIHNQESRASKCRAAAENLAIKFILRQKNTENSRKGFGRLIDSKPRKPQIDIENGES